MTRRATASTRSRTGTGRGSRSGSSPPATAASSRCSTARTSCSRSTDAVEIAYFLEATSATAKGPYDLTLVEGSITTPHDAERIHEIRRSLEDASSRSAPARRAAASRRCGTSPTSTTSSRPSTRTRTTSRRCAPRRRSPTTSTSTSSCRAARSTSTSCSRSSARSSPAAARTSRATASASSASAPAIPCVMVAHGTPCLGPVTQAGCGALCPLYARGCFGCFGPSEQPNTEALAARWLELGADDPALAAGVPRHHRQRAGLPEGGDASMSEQDRAADEDDPHRLPRPRRGRGRDARQDARRHGHRGEAPHLRAAAVLRGVPARTRLHRGAGHHRAHLRHLPGRLPDELLPRDGAARRRRGRRPAARAAPAPLLRRVDRVAHAARLHAPRARLPRRRERGRAREDQPGARRDGAAAEEDRQRGDARRRRPRGAPDQRPRRRLVQGADPGAARRARARPRVGAGRRRSRRCASSPGSTSPSSSRTTSSSRSTRTASTRSTAAAGSSPTAGSTSRSPSSSTTSSRSTSSTRTRSTPGCANAARTSSGRSRATRSTATCSPPHAREPPRPRPGSSRSSATRSARSSSAPSSSCTPATRRCA